MVKNKVKASDSFYKKKVRLDVITRLLKTIRFVDSACSYSIGNETCSN